MHLVSSSRLVHPLSHCRFAIGETFFVTHAAGRKQQSADGRCSSQVFCGVSYVVERSHLGEHLHRLKCRQRIRAVWLMSPLTFDGISILPHTTSWNHFSGLGTDSGGNFAGEECSNGDPGLGLTSQLSTRRSESATHVSATLSHFLRPELLFTMKFTPDMIGSLSKYHCPHC